MPTPRRNLRTDTLDAAFAELREQLDVPDAFAPSVLAAAAAAALQGPAYERRDVTDLPLLTIDPPGSKDLDQAVHVAAIGGGALRVSYAIADVAAFVRPGDPVDVEAWERGVSRYSPDRVTPLHPPELCEGAASLLPGQDRPAVLWTLTVDSSGELTDTHVERALVRSREQLTYEQAQARIDSGSDAMLTELSRLGRLRAEREWVRGGVSLELPDQEVIARDDGTYDLALRAPLPVEGWNAQVSLLTGHAAGLLMVAAGIGILRTLPAPDVTTVQGLRRRAWALGLPWPEEISYPDFVRTLDPHQPTEAAMIALAAVGLRGAGYAAFDGELPQLHRHEAIAAVYAHVTAPLRRLVDRYAGEIALAVAADQPVPSWVGDRLADLPKAMARAGGRAAALDRAVVDLVEAHLLADDVGRTLAATVVRSDERGSELQLRNPAVLVRV
ncbi:MAG TPA: RNB domain-containing ribonuclease, partial [Euzebya sp.]|nr:RNB domain-containing ribonuclease [Euzebya sp.]